MSKNSKIFTRKLQKISNSFLVTLPIEFVRKHKLENDVNPTVNIEVNPDWSLMISPDFYKNKKDIPRELKIHVYREVGREIVENILSGIERITVISDKKIDKTIRDEIRYFLEGIPQAEIIEEEPQRIVVYNLSFKKIPSRQIIRRLLSIASELFQNVRQEKEQEILRNITELKKFYMILVGHIRTYHLTGILDTDEEDLTQKRASDYRIFSYQIKQIGKFLEEIKLSPKMLEYYIKVEHYFNEIYDAFLKNNVEESYKLWFKNKALEKEGKGLEKDMTGVSRCSIRDLLKIINICRSMTSFI